MCKAVTVVIFKEFSQDFLGEIRENPKKCRSRYADLVLLAKWITALPA
jgi:hypothetical protein